MAITFISVLVFCTIQIYPLMKTKMDYTDEKKTTDSIRSLRSIIFVVLGVGSLMSTLFPGRITELFCITRASIFFLTICTFYYLGCSQRLTKTDKISIEQYKVLARGRTFVINMYLICNVFITPFCENFFAIYLQTSVYYAIELTMVSIYFKKDKEIVYAIVLILQWCILMFASSYSIRKVLT